MRTGTRWQLTPDAVLGLEGARQTSDAGEAANEVRQGPARWYSARVWCANPRS